MDEPDQVKPQVIASTSWNARRRGYVRIDGWWIPVEDPDGPEMWDALIDPEPWRADA